MKGLRIILLLLFCKLTAAQSPHFRKLTTADGLNDGSIESFAQDKYGYIWIGTSSGVNRYDGYRVKQYLNIPGDTTSIYPGHVWTIALGPDGNMYFGMGNGFLRFSYSRNTFTRLKAAKRFAVGTMVISGKNLLLGTSAGLAIYNPKTEGISFFSDAVTDSSSRQLALRGINDMEILAEGKVLATTRIGLLIIDLAQKSIRQITVPKLASQSFSNVEVTKDGTVWINNMNAPMLVRTDLSFMQFAIYDYIFPNKKVVKNALSELFVDRNDRLWVTTVSDGLCLYNKQRDSFTRFINDPFQPSSLTANHLTAIFQDRQGIIWTGTGGGYGVNYFHPDKKFFETILPYGNARTAGGWMWGRAASQDEKGHLWLATLDGVAEYSFDKGFIRSFKNEESRQPQIYSNSVRGVLCDDDRVWMITGEGINCYNRTSERMEFLDEKDSLPKAFYFTGFKDSRGNVWIGGRDYDGLYLKEPGESFKGIRHHPVLKKISGHGVRSIFEDSKQRVWFGLNGNGLAVYNPQKQTVKHWQRKEGDAFALTGNLVTGIGEDKDGLYWISTTTGISCYNERTDKFTSYTTANGLPSAQTSAIRVDRQNRVWAGSTQGMLMLDSTRKSWRVFGKSDGLPTVQFSDMPSSLLSDGRFVFPSLNGFVLFDPGDYTKEEEPLQVFVSSFKVFNEPADTKINFEEVKSIRLHYDQNFFTIELTALHYENPLHTWYAYQLEGFDKEWIYTQNRVVNYTNVPGGVYRFRYKATTDPGVWDVPEKVLHLSVATVYYKTIWFWLLAAILFAVSLYRIYRFRMNKQKQILQLETKARELEKEKTVVQYESLKQHLNPHFLFNSLTSLRSLIKTDVKTATGFLDGLSKVYRYVLRSGEKELSLLRDEIDFVKTFVSLQKIRFGDGLNVIMDVDEEYNGCYIVPVTLQNLIENAIKHNTADRESPLTIRITATGGYVMVKNNLQRYGLVESSNKQGLKSLQKLYRFYTDRRILIGDDGKTFTVKIPLL